MSRLDDPRLVAREYATLDRLAARRLDRTGWLRDAHEPLATLLAAIAEVRPRRVLDAGCGDGAIAAHVACPEVVCVDQSAAAVAAARERGLEAVQGDIERLPFPDDSFDVVMCNWTLYHLADIDRGLSELARVMRRGGRLVGAYNRSGHLSELWDAVGCSWPGDSFDGETGVAILQRHWLQNARAGTRPDRPRARADLVRAGAAGPQSTYSAAPAVSRAPQARYLRTP